MKFKKYLIIPLIFLLPIFSYVNAITLQELRNDTNLKLVISTDRADFYIDQKSTKDISLVVNEPKIQSITYIVDYKNALIFEDHITYTYNPSFSIKQQIEDKIKSGIPKNQKLIDDILADKEVASGITSASSRKVIYGFDGKVLNSSIQPKTLTFENWGTPGYELGNEIYLLIYNHTFDNF